jgi:hypothetical protein
MSEDTPIVGKKVQIKTSYAIRQTFVKAVGWTLGIVLVVIALYFAGIVTTAARFVSTDSLGIVLTKDPMLVEGSIPSNSVVLARIDSDKDMLSNAFSKLTLGTTYQRDVSEMKIIAGPAGRLTLDAEGHLLYNNKSAKVDVPVNMPERGWLTNAYLVQCTGGTCKAGATYVISEKAILGQVVNGGTSK